MTDTFPADQGQKGFKADFPNQLWVAEVAYVVIWSGFAHVAFITDAFCRKIVGWSVSSTPRTVTLPL